MGLFSFLSFLIVTSLGTLYPIYLSYKAIKANDLQSLEVLLMYWIVIGSVNAFENTLGWLVNWLPFYYEAKTILLLWLTLPQIQGSTFVYVTYLHPFLLEHEPEIDALIAEATHKCKKAGADYIRRTIEKLKDLLFGLVTSSNSINQSQSHTQAASDAQPDRAASVYAFNLLRQFAPAAVAVFQSAENPTDVRALPNSARNHDQLLRSTANPRSVQPAALSGYQIPEYDSSPPHRQRTPGSLEVPGSRGSVGRRHSSTHPHAGSAHFAATGTQMHHSSSVSGMSASSGYEEIMQDEASGSETEWITSQHRRRTTPKPRTSMGQIPDRAPFEAESEALLDRPSSSGEGRKTNPPGPGWWFGWGGKPIEQFSRKND